MSTNDFDVERQRLEEAQTFLVEVRELIEEAESDIERSIYALARVTPLGARDEVVNELYWTQLNVKAGVIAQAFAYGPKTLTNQGIIKPHYRSDICCTVCGVPHEITSRSKLTDLQRAQRRAAEGKHNSTWQLECDQCRSIRFADRDRQYETMRKARQERLYLLRTMPYRDYLQTPEWQDTRQRKLRSAGFRCELCNGGNTILDVHHRTYERRGDEYFKDLIVLCRDCHSRFHDKVGSAT